MAGAVVFRLDSPTIDELNFFANRIAQMDDSELAIFRTVAPKVLGSPADDLLSMKDLINCTYGYDEIMVASNIRTDEQLGQFIIENELHDDVNNIPESSLYLLDKAKIGALYRTSLNCDLTDGYAIFAGEYKPPEIYDGNSDKGTLSFSSEMSAAKALTDNEEIISTVAKMALMIFFEIFMCNLRFR